MSRFLGFLTVLGVVAVTLLQQLGVAWAAETTGQGVSASLYAGGGQLEEPNNEGAPSRYDERRAGLGVTGVVRFRGAARFGEAETEGEPPPRRDGVSELGGFALFGAGFELEGLKEIECGFRCDSEAHIEEGYRLVPTYAGRFNLGYSFRYVELRGGVLASMPTGDAAIADPLVLPDVSVRFGRRSVGWFELGLGAYDAPTNLRPGLYVGGGAGSADTLRVGWHFGVHLPNGLCCSTVTYVGFRSELSVERRLSDRLVLGVGAAAFNLDTFEGSTRLSLLL